MRKPRKHVLDNGEIRWRVRFRQGSTETSETFRHEPDAITFAAIVSSGPDGVVEALAWLNQRRKQSAAPTFAEYLPHYVDQLTGVTPRTRAEYGGIATRYLSSIADVPLPLITRSHVTAVVNELEAAGRAPKTIKNVVHSLASVLALAVEEGHIAKNPTRRVKLPEAQLDEVEIRFLEYEEFERLYGVTPVDYRPLLTTLVGTGMRWSEATAIYTRHVSIERGTIRVQQAWKWEGAGRGWALGPPKSKKSRRTVNAATIALAHIAPLLGKPNEHVFTTPTGRVVRHNNFYNRIWLPTIEKAKLDGADGHPATRIHDLRHTHASWLISDGQSLEAVQDQLGHESILTTRKIYGHLLPAVGVAVGKSASEALARSLVHSVEAGGGLLAIEPVQVPE